MAGPGIKSEILPPLDIPPSPTAVEVSIIDTTTDIVCPASGFVSPVLKGHEAINMPTWAFHIKHPSGNEVLFDLGARKDWWTTAPASLDAIKKSMLGIHVSKGVDEILADGGVDLNKIKAAVISHWHWDHIGDPTRLPPGAELVVGPGFKEHLMPGWPANPDAHLLDSIFENRTVREAAFDPSFKIGSFEAHDFFGDGSFYLLNTPGHATGHISALARTTTSSPLAEDDTFVFMGGDICHFGGAFRPTASAPLPDEIAVSPSLPLNRPGLRLPCPCSLFTACHPQNLETQTPGGTTPPPLAASADPTRSTPFYAVTRARDGWYVDPPQAQRSVDALQQFDADPRVFVAIAHDEGLRGVVTWFPHGSLNAWREKGWKEQARWGFLGTLPEEGRSVMEPLVVGLGAELHSVDLS
ncbi:beta-lactamase-like protein [Phyllosticta capitalensis]|uniref:Beta-lactamase-like protein n=1 Tax=Phyllosticta capitalensis TaxID=121624 RepID=A0ABR1YNZ2_9PEZI